MIGNPAQDGGRGARLFHNEVEVAGTIIAEQRLTESREDVPARLQGIVITGCARERLVKPPSPGGRPADNGVDFSEMRTTVGVSPYTGILELLAELR